MDRKGDSNTVTFQQNGTHVKLGGTVLLSVTTPHMTGLMKCERFMHPLLLRVRVSTVKSSKKRFPAPLIDAWKSLAGLKPGATVTCTAPLSYSHICHN